MELLETAAAFGLHSYGKPAPDGRAFQRFSDTVCALFEGLGVTPSFVGIEGEGYSGEYKKFGGMAHKKLVKAGFEGITVLSVVANPEGSDDPSYDGYAKVSFSFVESMQEALLCFVVNEWFVRFASKPYDNAWGAFLGLNAWDFGYGFVGEVEKQPEFHILGLDNGKLSADEQSALNAWYGALPGQRLDCLRGIYPYNFVSTRQLAQDVLDGMTLRQFINQDGYGEIAQLTDYGLHLWKIDEAETDQAHTQLRSG